MRKAIKSKTSSIIEVNSKHGHAMSDSRSKTHRKVLSFGQVAQRCGIAVSAVHFYESKGRVSSWRNNGNQRRYTREVLRRIAIIKVAQHTGIRLASTRDAFANLPAGRTPIAQAWQQLSALWAADPGARMQRLTQLRDPLGGRIGYGCLSLATCPLHNPSDTLAEQFPARACWKTQQPATKPLDLNLA